MNIVKIRAWNPTTKTMIYPIEGDLIKINDKGELEYWFGATKCIIMLFTGLFDKQGKEIYEGDIVKGLYWIDERDGSVCTGKIQWNVDDACFEIEWISGSPYGATDMLDVVFNFEVIGNIYENPELLRKE